MKRILFYYFFPVTLFQSCSNSNAVTDKINPTNPIGKVTLSDSASFNLFWKSFRDVVISSKVSGIVEKIQKPLEIRGYEDTDPIYKLYDKDSISTYFDKFLDERNVSYQDLATHREFIKKISDIKQYDTTTVIDGTKTVENMMFRKLGAEWKLSRIYMDSKKLK